MMHSLSVVSVILKCILPQLADLDDEQVLQRLISCDDFLRSRSKGMTHRNCLTQCTLCLPVREALEGVDEDCSPTDVYLAWCTIGTEANYYSLSDDADEEPCIAAQKRIRSAFVSCDSWAQRMAESEWFAETSGRQPLLQCFFENARGKPVPLLGANQWVRLKQAGLYVASDGSLGVLGGATRLAGLGSIIDAARASFHSSVASAHRLLLRQLLTRDCRALDACEADYHSVTFIAPLRSSVQALHACDGDQLLNGMRLALAATINDAAAAWAFGAYYLSGHELHRHQAFASLLCKVPCSVAAVVNGHDADPHLLSDSEVDDTVLRITFQSTNPSYLAAAFEKVLRSVGVDPHVKPCGEIKALSAA